MEANVGERADWEQSGRRTSRKQATKFGSTRGEQTRTRNAIKSIFRGTSPAWWLKSSRSRAQEIVRTYKTKLGWNWISF